MNNKKYIIDNSELMKEWDEEKNSEIGLYANEITEGSKKKAFWKCSKGHSYPMMIYNKACLHRGCSICSKRRISSDNNLKALYPELAKEWDYEKNKKRPEEVFPHSNKKYYWICLKGHESYSANPNNRTQGDGCPRCSGNQVSEDNNLVFLFPEIAKEWHPTLNDKKPNEFTAYSNKTATWICENGHVWKAKINNRTHGKGCRECSKGNQSSFPEQAIYYYLKSLFITTKSGYKIDGNEVDVYLPDFKIAIEYDGYRYHKTQKKLKSDINKNIFLFSKGIKLIRIREVGCANMPEENCKIIMCNYESSLLYLKEVIEQLISVISNITNDNYKINVDITKDRFKIRSQYKYSLKEKSLLALNPSLATEWDYEANYPATPDTYFPGSEEKVSWICSKNPNHKWQATINSRNSGVGCRFCNGKEACEDNCLATTHPELAKEWDYELNEKTPNDYTYGSKQIVNWKCSKGHPSYPAAINSRTRKDRPRGCPYCSGQKVCLGTSIMTLYPNIIEEWDYERNYPLTPDKVTKTYTKSKIWWKCSKGHSYEAYISQRIRGSKCSVCNGRQVITETSLAFLFPDIAEEWDYEKNKPLTPWDVGKGYDKDIWWKCKNPNHPSFKAKVYNRTKKKTKCPYCRKEHLISI